MQCLTRHKEKEENDFYFLGVLIYETKGENIVQNLDEIANDGIGQSRIHRIPSQVLPRHEIATLTGRAVMLKQHSQKIIETLDRAVEGKLSEESLTTVVSAYVDAFLNILGYVPGAKSGRQYTKAELAMISTGLKEFYVEEMEQFEDVPEGKLQSALRATTSGITYASLQIAEKQDYLKNKRYVKQALKRFYTESSVAVLVERQQSAKVADAQMALVRGN